MAAVSLFEYTVDISKTNAIRLPRKEQSGIAYSNVRKLDWGMRALSDPSCLSTPRYLDRL